MNGPVGSRSSFSSDFNSCLFDGWPPNVLAGKVTCSGKQLCYGGHGSAGKEQALFAVCYNTTTLIPEFTGHFLQSGGQTVSPPGILTNPDDINKEWISDTTLGKSMTPQVPTDLERAFSRVDLSLRRRNTRYNNPQLVAQLTYSICCSKNVVKNEQQSEKLLLEVDQRSTFRNNFLQPATNVFVAGQVDGAR